MAKTYQAGVKEYRETYWMPEYTPKDTDILACFKITPQPGVPREEAAAAVDQVPATHNWETLHVQYLELLQSQFHGQRFPGQQSQTKAGNAPCGLSRVLRGAATCQISYLSEHGSAVRHVAAQGVEGNSAASRVDSPVKPVRRDKLLQLDKSEDIKNG